MNREEALRLVINASGFTSLTQMQTGFRRQAELIAQMMVEDQISQDQVNREMIASYAITARLIDSEKMAMNDPNKSHEYWGSPEHQVDLANRLGFSFEVGQDISDEEFHQIFLRMLQAQMEEVDNQGRLLHRSDFMVLGYVTGFSA